VDYAFGANCDNVFIFQTFGTQIVDSALEGFNTVLFMYGQTSSGKTFTLFGAKAVEGLVGHSLAYIYKRVMESEDSEYVIKVSYAELYNEELRDLLSPTPNENLKIIDDPVIGPVIQNITQENFSTADEVKHILAEGESRRHFGVTNMNAHSSRSHVLVRLSIESRKIGLKSSTPLRGFFYEQKKTQFLILILNFYCNSFMGPR
jgi:Kinesin motor domain